MDIKYFTGKKIISNPKRKMNVYHYTSPAGFLSIIEQGKLWFSDIQFLNDRSEYVYIKELFKEAEKNVGNERRAEDEKFIDYILGPPYEGYRIKPSCKPGSSPKRGLALEHVRYYILCASVEQDSHSLWNYYVKNNNYQGYNIGISVNSLIDSIAQQNSTWNITHGIVSYDRSMQIKNIQSKLIELKTKFDSDIRSGNNEDICIDDYQDNLTEYLLERCLFYKNPAFAHEKEYRFVIENSVEGNSEIKYHVGSNGLIVPHLELEFSPQENIKNVTLAPMMEREAAKTGVKLLLKNKYSNLDHECNVDFSKINVRF